MTHTAGLAYGARNPSAWGAEYRANGIDSSSRNHGTLAETVLSYRFVGNPARGGNTASRRVFWSGWPRS